ncbi:MAG: hypothetical protein JKY95_06015 [Planctomycetaceae bacterium]|nr:hypothetical protein [Planctomycetaceae bacterium]
MSRRCTEPALSVSLFPFLAVLVCAMGALILLLLIITRQVRSEAVQQANQVLATPVETSEIESYFTPKVRPARIQVPEKSAPAEIPFSEEELKQITLAPDARQYDERLDGNQKQIELLKSQADALQHSVAQQKTIQTQMASVSRLLSQQENKSRELQTQLNSLSKRKMYLDEWQAEQQIASRKTDEEMRQLQGLLQKKQQQLKAQQKIASELEGKLEIVTYDGASGIRRKPIFVECLDGKIVFQPEQVELALKDDEGFSPGNHPLGFAVRALAEYRNQKNGTQQPAYVLLVVRAQGIKEFYTSRQILGVQGITFGYELVGQDQELYFSEQDPHAKKVLEDAIARARQQPKINRRSGFQLGPGRGMSGNRQAFSKPPLPGRSSGEFTNPGSVEDGTAGKLPQRMVSRGTDYNRLSSVPSYRTPSNRTGSRRRKRNRESGSKYPKQNTELSSRSNGHASAMQGSSENTDSSSRTSAREGSPTDQLKELIEQSGTPGSPMNSPLLKSLSSRARNLKRGNQSTLISIERNVTVHIHSKYLKLGTQEAVPISGNESEIGTQKMFLYLLEQEMSRWEAAPQGFRWIPGFRFVVAPGGNQVAFRLESVAKELSLGMKTSFTIGQQSPAKNIELR